MVFMKELVRHSRSSSPLTSVRLLKSCATLMLTSILIAITMLTLIDNGLFSVMASPLIETTVYRGIMYDRHTGSSKVLQHGSRSVLLRGYVALYNNTNPSSSPSSSQSSHSKTNEEKYTSANLVEQQPNSTYAKQTVYIPCTSHLTKSVMDAFVHIPVRGLLLPLCSEDAFNEEFLSQYISTNAALPFPVYFMTDDRNVKLLEDALSAEVHSAERVVISIGTSAKLSKTYENNTLEGLTIYNQLQYKPNEIRQAIATKQAKASSKIAKESKKNTKKQQQQQEQQQQEEEEQEGKLNKDISRVLITANFDTLGVAPAARTNASASAIVAGMELWRRMTTLLASEPFASLSLPASSSESNNININKNNNNSNSIHDSTSTTLTKSQESSKGSINPFVLNMMLSNSARFNYVNTAQWLAGLKEADLNRLKMVISLDELVSDELDGDANTMQKSHSPREVELYMHVQDSLLKRADGQSVQTLALRTAAKHNIDLYIVSAKANYRNYDIRFEQEVFAHRQIPAVTFSAYKSSHVDQLFRDRNPPEFTEELLYKLRRRVDFIEAFTRELLNVSSTTIASVAAERNNAVDSMINPTWKPPVTRLERWAGSISYLQGMSHFVTHAARSPVAESSSEDEVDGGKYSTPSQRTNTKTNKFTSTRLSRGVSSVNATKQLVSPQHQFAQQIEQHLKTLNARLTGAPVFVSSTLQSSTMKLGSITLYGPYEEKMKIFVAVQSKYELLMTCVILCLLLCFTIYQYSFAGLQYIVLGDKTWKDVLQLLKPNKKAMNSFHDNDNSSKGTNDVSSQDELSSKK